MERKLALSKIEVKKLEKEIREYQRESRGNWKDKKLRRLERRLLSLGGHKVVHQCEPHANQLLNRGTIFNFPVITRIQNMPHTPSNCHSNIAAAWHNNERKGFEIVTGWALTTNDGLWRQHTFGLLNNKIIDSTSKRDLYFGVKLTFDESVRFFLSNWNNFDKILPNKYIYKAIKKLMK